MRTYQQCKLKKGDSFETAWIPSEFATEGKHVQIKRGGKWQNGWEVAEVYAHKMDEKTVLARRDDYRNHRKMTDI